MQRLLIVLVLVVAVAVGVGFYMGWFRFASDSGNGESNITFTVDVDKIQEDKEKAVEKVHDLGGQGKEKASAPAGKATDPVTPLVPSPPK
jgi:hypothetical protein